MESSNARLVLGLALGFALGIAVGWFLPSMETGGQPGAVTLGGARAAEARPARVEQQPAFDLEPERAERSVAPAGAGPAASAISDAEVERRVAGVERPRVEHETGAATIYGRVTDDAERGVPDVVLRAVRSNTTRTIPPSSIGQGAPPLADMEQALRDAARRQAETLARTYEARSDASGAWRFAGLPEGRYRISAYKADHVVELVEGSSYDVPTGTELAFRARPVLRVPVRVTLEDGSTPERAAVSCTPQGDARTRTTSYDWSPEEPELRLVPGSYEIAALGELIGSGRYSSQPEAALRAEPQRVELVAGTAPPALVFVLTGRAGIRGRVTFAKDGVTGWSGRVHLLELGAAGEPDLMMLSESDRTTYLRGDDDYAFLDLEPGRYAVGVTRTYDGPICAHAVVDVAGAIVRRDLDVPPFDLSQYLSVLVYGADGELLGDVDFQFVHRSAEGGSSWGSGTMRGPDGSHIVTIPPEARRHYFAGTEGHSFSLTVQDAAHGSSTVELPPGQTSVEVVFAVPASLEVAIAGYSAREHAGRVHLSLEHVQEGDERHMWSHQTFAAAMRADGTGHFEAVEPGAYVLVLSLSGESGSRRGNRSVVAEEEIRLGSGESSASIALPALYEVDLRWAGEDPAQGASLRSRGAEGRTAERIGSSWAGFDERGRARFGSIPAGSYTVSVWTDKGGAASRDIEVPCGEVELRPD